MLRVIKTFVFLLAITTILSGCVKDIDTSIKDYNAVKDQVELGDDKGKVLTILLPTQSILKPEYKKSPEKYMKNGVTVEIYFMRSLRQRDGSVTDDEFTPYVFNDGKLVGIGWTVLGGAKTQGQTSDTYTTTVINENTNNTEVIVY